MLVAARAPERDRRRPGKDHTRARPFTPVTQELTARRTGLSTSGHQFPSAVRTICPVAERKMSIVVMMPQSVEMLLDICLGMRYYWSRYW